MATWASLCGFPSVYALIPSFLIFFLSLPSPFCPLILYFHFFLWLIWLVWLVGMIGNPRYIYIQAHVFVDDEQATSSLQPSVRPYCRT